MKSTSGFVAAIVAAVVLVFGASAIVTHARAAGGAGPNTSCTSTSPCLTESNTSSGDGAEGTSAKGVGLDGRTSAKGSTAGGAGFGVSGTDTRTTAGTGLFNAGVKGTSTNGTGVEGTSTNGFGVSGSSTNFGGVMGVGGFDGVSASGGTDGVVGQTTGTNVFPFNLAGGIEGATNVSGDSDVIANNFNSGAQIFRGNNSSGIDVFTVDDSGNTTMAGNASIGGSNTVGGGESVTGASTIGGGGVSNALDVNLGLGSVTGILTAGSSVGIFSDLGATGGSGGNYAMEAENNTAAIGFYCNCFGGDPIVINNSQDLDTLIDFDSGNLQISGDIFTAGACSGGCINGRPDSRIAQYGAREAQPTTEDFGEANLVGGQGYVHLDPTFARTIDQRSNYLVFITPEGDNRGLYVTQKSLGGFMVRESQNGHSTITFSYRIVAKPYGSTELRLAPIFLAHRSKLSHEMGRLPVPVKHPVQVLHKPKH